MFPSRRPVDPSRKTGGERLRRRSHAAPPTQTNMYAPSIYSYTCRGKFYASSETKDGSEGGVCNGFKSKLDVLYVANQENISRAEALKRFTSMVSDVDLDDYHSAANTSELHQQAKSILLSPALIYKNLDKKQTVGDDEKTPVVNPIKLAKDQILPEEELIKRQEWSCYGSTEVEYLVLEDVKTGEKKVAAVAPLNTGISFREIETEDSVRLITRVGLGWLDIIYDSHSDIVDAVENEQDVQQQQQRMPEEVPPRPTMDSLQIAKQSLIRTYDFSRHVAEHMKFNLQWLGSNLQDDFPARTYAAGKNIVAQLPSALDHTANTMGKILSRIFGSDDDSDERD
jgi:hypothetical protein